MSRTLGYSLTAAALGWAALGLRFGMETLAMDDKGLLIPGHWTGLGLGGLGLLSVLFLWYVYGKMGTWGMHDECFPKSALGGMLSMAGGLLLGVSSLSLVDPLDLLLGVGCGVVMVVLGVLRLLGKKPPFVLHCAICLYWVTELVRQYPQWSGSSQVQNYACQLLALVALMLYAFHRCSADADSIHPRKLAVTALAALGLSIPAMVESGQWLWYLSAGLWVAGSMGTLDPTPSQELIRRYNLWAPCDPQRAFPILLELLCRLDTRGFLELGETFAQWIPELKPCLGFDQKTPHHAYDVYTHTAHVAGSLPADPALRLAALLHDVGKPQSLRVDEKGRGHFKGHALGSARMAVPILERLGAPQELIQEVRWLIARHMIKPGNTKALAVVQSQALPGWMERLLLLQAADARGKGIK